MSNTSALPLLQNWEIPILLSQWQHAQRPSKRRIILLKLYWLCGQLADQGDPGTGETQKNWSALFQQQAGEAPSSLSIPLRDCLKFYRAFPQRSRLNYQLNWTQYKLLSRIKDEKAREYYFRESIQSHWTARELKRQIDAKYYERMQQEEEPAEAPASPAALKDYYVLEFINQDLVNHREERALETALLNKLQAFLLELGKGFAFVARQKRITTESGKPFYIDLVFYHFILKCFILFELKAGELSHRDIGQLDLYVRLYEEKYRQADDRPTLGIILCTEKDHTLVKYSMLQNNRQLFAATYSLYLPSREAFDDLFQNVSDQPKH